MSGEEFPGALVPTLGWVALVLIGLVAGALAFAELLSWTVDLAFD